MDADSDPRFAPFRRGRRELRLMTALLVVALVGFTVWLWTSHSIGPSVSIVR